MRINYVDEAFVIEEKGNRKVLLDCKDLLGNKSRIPMQSLTGDITIPQLILNVWENSKEIAMDTEWEKGLGLIASFLIDILVTSHLVSTSLPMKVVEIGAIDGVLSFNLASLMGIINNESSLCSICNVIGNDSDNHWLDKIVMVEQPPKLSMLVSDYDETELQSDNFDIVILNGMFSLAEPYDVIREAERIVKKDGIIICYQRSNPLLESTFKLVFPDYKEYELTSDEKVLTVQCISSSWEPYKDKEESAQELLNEMKKSIENGSTLEQLRSFVVRMDSCINTAISRNDLEHKVRLLNIKEKVLDFMLNIGKADEEFYKEALSRVFIEISISL